MKTFKMPLSPEKEKEYLTRYKDGDMEARNLLIEHNLRLVAHVAKKYQSPEQDMDDLISIGIIGLIKAVITFDSEKNSRLATYAARCIENAILSQMRLWFQTSPLRAEKSQNGVLWHRFPRTSISFVLLREAM